MRRVRVGAYTLLCMLVCAYLERLLIATPALAALDALALCFLAILSLRGDMVVSLVVAICTTFLWRWAGVVEWFFVPVNGLALCTFAAVACVMRTFTLTWYVPCVTLAYAVTLLIAGAVALMLVKDMMPYTALLSSLRMLLWPATSALVGVLLAGLFGRRAMKPKANG